MMATIKVIDKMRSQIYDREALHESFFNNTLDGLAYCQMVFDIVGRPVDWIYLEVNKNFEKLMGLQNVVGKKATELIPGINRSNPELFEIYGRVSLTGRPERFETYVEPLSRWFLVAVYCPKKKFFVAVFQDITDQKQKEKDLENAKIAARNVLEDLQTEKEKLAEAKAKDEAMLASIGDGMVATDQNARVIFINEVGEKLVGWKKEEIFGKSWIELVPMYDQNVNTIPDGKRPIAQAISQKKTTTTTTTTTTYYFIKKDKTKFPVAVTATPIILNGQVIGAICVYRDITREKEIEKLRADFLSLASHQLRTPLSGTKWLIETMQRKILGPVTPKQKEYLDQIAQMNERMIKLVFSMLNVLQLEAGATLVKKEVLSIPDLYGEIVLMTSSAAHDKGVLLYNVLKDHKVITVETDVTMLRSILEIFVSNAINYSQRGQEIILDAKEEENAVVFFVKDSGVGIPKDEQKRIFEKFYRASNAKPVKPDGTGLGLYIASMLAEKIGAKILFESEENKGSTFYLRIPKKMNT